MCSSTYMAFSQNTSHPVGRSPLWHFARTFLNFCHFEGVRMALGQTWFAHMQEPFTRIPNLVSTQKWQSAPMLEIPRTRQKYAIQTSNPKKGFLENLLIPTIQNKINFRFQFFLCSFSSNIFYSDQESMTLQYMQWLLLLIIQKHLNNQPFNITWKLKVQCNEMPFTIILY